VERTPTRWWHTDPDRAGGVVCTLCPRLCHIGAGQRGFCYVRENVEGALELTTYGRSSGFCIDPIEKKPLAHYLPGSSILSLGTAGCNLGCRFCQNWNISKSREDDALAAIATPEAIAQAALDHGCRSIAFTYNDPVIWAEYAIDIARAARPLGLATVAVTAGYISPEPRREFYAHMDATNVDLKAFTEEFYRKTTLSHIEPVLDTLRYLVHETKVWTEITTLVIPGHNDDPAELRELARWVYRDLNADVPLHFSAFHPDFKMRDVPHTPHATLVRARDIAMSEGLRYVYIGNVHDPDRESTRCPGCGTTVIARDRYEITAYRLRDGCCTACGARIPGRFDDVPGSWGRRRQPIRIGGGER